MKDDIAKPLLDALRGCVRKLRQEQLAAEGMLFLPWIEISIAESAISQFRSETPKMTSAEGVVYETFEASMTKFEAFADEFGRTAQTPYQRELAANFKTFVEDLGRSTFGKNCERPELER